MKVLILYFSGTGNTAYIAKYILDRLKTGESEVEIASIEQFQESQVSNFDLLVFGFPVYACNAPIFVQNYIEGIPITSSKGLFLFCTKGIYSGNALNNTSKQLEKKGYILHGYADITMPGSDGLAFLNKTSSIIKKATQRDYQNIKSVEHMIGKMENIVNKAKQQDNLKCDRRVIRTNVGGTLVGGLFTLIYKPIENSFKRRFWADKNCVKCKICEKICPSSNIIVSEKGVVFDKKCYLCMRCIHQCPKEAIQIGKGTIGKFRWKGPDGKFNPMV